LSKRSRRSNLALVDNNAAPAKFNEYVKQRRTVSIVPRSLNQEKYVHLLLSEKYPIVYSVGPAGTGKTMLAVLAGIKAYKEGTVEKIILTRPAVGVEDEQHGFLPGDLNSKMEPWTKPLMDVITEYYSPKEVVRMLEEQIIEICPLAYMRGRNFKNSWIIFDEAQNCTINQMKMILTRLGDGSKIVVTGDLQQMDRQFKLNNGLSDVLERITSSKNSFFGYTEFSSKDVQRSLAVKEVLNLYGEN
jgi:phosphate starvation-inducible PhoH-like protein